MIVELPSLMWLGKCAFFHSKLSSPGDLSFSYFFLSGCEWEPRTAQPLLAIDFQDVCHRGNLQQNHTLCHLEYSREILFLHPKFWHRWSHHPIEYLPNTMHYPSKSDSNSLCFSKCALKRGEGDDSGRIFGKNTQFSAAFWENSAQAPQLF
jgi:hypothetical protein